MNRVLSVIAAALASLALVSGSWANTNPFPHREKFKDVPVVESAALLAKLPTVHVIDVRSKFEFDTLHIKGAINIPLNNTTFAGRVAEFVKANPKPVVFYCNGGSCKKSYHAVQEARKGGVNGAAYDAGIYSWAQTYPQHSVLLGKNPMNAHEFIDNSRYKSHFVDANKFENMMGPTAMVLDIRDRIQRDLQLFPFKENRAELQDMESIKYYVRQAKSTNKTLLVYDKVGKQVRWFQYLLEREGVKNYYFMKGGSEGYYEAKLGNFKVTHPEN